MARCGWCERDWKACVSALFWSMAERGEIAWGLMGLSEKMLGEAGELQGGMGLLQPNLASGTNVMPCRASVGMAVA